MSVQRAWFSRSYSSTFSSRLVLPHIRETTAIGKNRPSNERSIKEEKTNARVLFLNFLQNGS